MLLNGLVFALQSFAQHQPSAPQDGERLDYIVTYEWGPFYLEVGDVSFTTASLAYGDERLWSFEGWGASRKHWNWFYEVNSIYSSIADTSLNSMNFQRKGREGSHRYNRWYFLDDRQEKEWLSMDDELDSGSLLWEMEAPLHDVMTAVHHCRHLPWETFSPGDSIGLNLILDGEVHQTRIDFVGTTQYSEPYENEEIACWEFVPTLIEGTVFKAGDQMRVLVTADERRLPLFVETELIVGRARIYLQQKTTLDREEMRLFRSQSVVLRDAALED